MANKKVIKDTRPLALPLTICDNNIASNKRKIEELLNQKYAYCEPKPTLPTGNRCCCFQYYENIRFFEDNSI